LKNKILRAIVGLGAVACLLAGGAARAQPVSGIWLQGDPGSIAPTTPVFYAPPTDTFSYFSLTPTEVALNVNGSAFLQVIFTPAQGQTLVVGPYEGADRLPFNPPSPKPGIAVSVAGSNCLVAGRFSVLDIAYDSSFNIVSLALDFEAGCNGTSPPVYGELRLNSPVPFTFQKPAGAITPDPFGFTAQAHLAGGTTVVSNTTTIYGLNAPSPITISGGGEYSVNGGAFTSAPASVNNRDHVQVRTVSSTTPGATVSPTVTVGGVSAAFDVETYLTGDPLTILRFMEDYPGGVSGDTLPSDFTFHASWTGTGVSFLMQNLQGDSREVDLGPAPGAALTAGPYEQAVMYGARGASPGIFLNVPFFACGSPSGRFAVLEADLVPNSSTINRFAADFEIWCSNNAGPTFGEIRFNSTIPLTSLKPAGSTLPDPFAAQAQSPVAAGTTVSSNWFGIYGVNAPVPISITGGEYSLNGAAFTSAPGTAHNGDDVVLRVHASRTPGATTSATFAAGGRSVPFSVTTYQPGTALTGLYYRSTTGDIIGSGQTKFYLAPTNTITTSVAGGGVTVYLAGVDGAQLSLQFAAAGGAQLAPGTYENASAFSSSTQPQLSLLGGSVCGGTVGRFVVHELVPASGGPLQTFSADFEMHCNDFSTPPLFGEVRVNSTLPFTALTQGAARNPATDLNGDGKSDLLYRNFDTGQVYRMLMNGFSMNAAGTAYTEPNLAWSVVADADFTGDGITDLLWRNASTGQLYLQPFDATGMPAGGSYIYTEINPAWRIVQTPDLDGDGKADLVWWNSNTGQVYVMLMTDSGIGTQGMLYWEPNTAWKIVASGDFDGDGKQNELVWHNDATGQVYLMTVQVSAGGPMSTSGAFIYQEPNLDWQIVTAADFDHDGKSDLLWRNASTGQVYMMLMNGGTRVSEGYVYAEPNLAWKIVAAGDYNGDGKADLLWRNDTTGQVYMMLMDGLAISAQSFVYNEPNVAWKLLGPTQYAQ
jgi:hypothetical protein